MLLQNYHFKLFKLLGLTAYPFLILFCIWLLGGVFPSSFRVPSSRVGFGRRTRLLRGRDYYILAIFHPLFSRGLLLRRSAVFGMTCGLWVWLHRTPPPLRGRPNPLTVRSGSPPPRSPVGTRSTMLLLLFLLTSLRQ